ncbi:hypothetical protein F2Q69_00033499 [Brassica cretica]|uniref:Uncharacterized protein n=1 Tax=Brassica cretica TaxID=69181 RepID=A0A8S9SSJ9_BRACR|nr:hypothetical protein F2Q69_00033499 [Brassica cretica]
MFASCLQIARGSMTSLHQVAPHLERVDNPAAGRRSTRSLHFSKVVDERLSSEQVSHPGAKGSYCLRFVWSGCRRSLP